MPKPKQKTEIKNQTKEITFTDEEISKINSVIDDKDLINKNDKKILIELSNKSNISDVCVAKLFSKCYSSFLIISGNIKDKVISSKINQFIKKYSDDFDAIKIRNCVQDLDRCDGGIGTSYYENCLIKFVNSDRENYLKFIDFFFKVGGIND